MNQTLAVLGLCVAVLSTVIAAIALVVGRRNQKRIIEIEEERERDRKRLRQKADLVARIVKEGGPYSPHLFLVIENKGFAEAREVSVEVDGQAIAKHPAVVKPATELAYLGPQSAFKYYLALTMDGPIPKSIAITWADESGEPGCYRSALSIW